MLLIISNKTDLTADFVILGLKEKGINFERLNTEDFGKSYEPIIRMSNGLTSSEVIIGDNRITKNDIDGIYFVKPKAPKFDEEFKEEDREFAERETAELLSSFWRTLNRDKWLNYPKSIQLANNKIKQLIMAESIGLNTPDTLVTVNEDEILSFYEKYNGDIIAKAVKHGFYRKEEYIKLASTQEVTENYIKNIGEYSSVPMIFQNKLEKEYDLRVTVVEDKVFPTAIYSQEHEETKIDWRNWDLYESIDLRHEKAELPNLVKEKCVELVKGFNLNFSAMDIVKTAGGDYVFLELNPNGQWVWIQEKVGYPIREKIIDSITN